MNTNITSKEFVKWLEGFLDGHTELSDIHIKRIKEKMGEINDPIDFTPYNPIVPLHPMPLNPCSPNWPVTHPPYNPTCSDVWYTTSSADTTNNVNLDELDNKNAGSGQEKND